jgi:hypothetical protein
MEPSTTFNLNGTHIQEINLAKIKKRLKSWYSRAHNIEVDKLTVKEELDGNHVYVVSTENIIEAG